MKINDLRKIGFLFLLSLVLAVLPGCSKGSSSGGADAGVPVQAVEPAKTEAVQTVQEDAGTAEKAGDDYTLGGGGHRLKTFFTPSGPQGGQPRGPRLQVFQGGR